MVVVRPRTRNGKTTSRRRKVRQAHLSVRSDLLKRRRRKMFAFNFKKFLESGQYSDVDFAVKPEKFPVSKTFKAHRQLLALRNEVFAAMFYGQLPEKDVVVVTDLHPDGFYGLLKYLYTGKPKIKSTEEAMYTRTAADKYLVPHLALACSEYIRGHVTADDVCHVIDYTLLTGGEDVDGAVGRLLEERPEAVLASDAFTDCLEQTVHYVLDKVTNVPEMYVILAVHRWAQSFCQKIATTDDKPVDLKTAMAPFLPKLRFLALSPEEFVTFNASDDTRGVLDKDDAFAIMSLFLCNKSIEMPSWACPERQPRCSTPKKE
ncbi:BTB/POZ domain-containing protein 3-like [Dermacentor andersoni]|uniref:BTB/POZ domain-containing protein 3-like n=1 Tax=Dermacentor andersoni TaxID=34620 RepID=UPI002416DC64|nr:BTB/POZ domain-containing protein 3-like [Dermacentor andersoni]